MIYDVIDAHTGRDEMADSTFAGTTTQATRDAALTNDGHEVLGTTTTGGADRLAESLARIGVLLGVQRVELFRREHSVYSLVGYWTAIGHEPPPDVVVSSPVRPEWFPWSLGNVRPTESLFVRNGGSLPTRPGGGRRVRDYGMTSALCLPLTDGPTDESQHLGGLCVYWAEEQTAWPREHGDKALDLGRDALLDS